MARTTSCCVISCPRPRSAPSTSRRYRILSPSFIIAIRDYDIAICNASQGENRGSSTLRIQKLNRLLIPIRKPATLNPVMKAFQLAFALLAVPAAAQQYDLLLKGGHLIDPRNSLDARMDVAVTAGKIAAVRADIPASQA